MILLAGFSKMVRRLAYTKTKIKANSCETHQLHYTTEPLNSIIIIFNTVVSQKRNVNNTRQIMNSRVAPSWHFGMHHQGLTAAGLTCPAYVDGKKRENISL